MNIREKLLDILDANGIFVDRAKIEEDLDLREYVTDSLQYMSFIVEIERELKIEFPDEVLLFDNIASLNGFSTIIESVLAGEYVNQNEASSELTESNPSL